MERKYNNTGTHSLRLIVAFWIFCVLIYACGSGGDSGGQGGAGSVSFDFVLATPQSADVVAGPQPNQAEFACEEYEVATIEAQVLDENEVLLAEGGPWPCEDGEATLSDVEAGDNRIVKIIARNSDGAILYAGRSDPFSIRAGETTRVGTIELVIAGLDPVTNEDTATTEEDQDVIIAVLDNDADPYYNSSADYFGTLDPTTVTVVSPPLSGNTVVNADGTVRYIPNANSNGEDSFTYTVQDDFGAASNETLVNLTVTPIPVPPDPPGGVTATPGIGQITLNWLPVADATTYNVYFSTSAGVSKTNFEGDFHGIVQPSFTHSPLAGGVTYYYVVTAQNTIGESDDSAEVSATVTPIPVPPDPPGGVTATPGIGQITLNWLPVADATTYNVYFSTSAGVSKTNFEGDFHGIVQPSFTHSPLAGGVTYYYVVTAQNTIGESDDSAEVSATVIPIPVPPDPPDGVAATPGIGQISLDWLPVADATTYNVYFSTSAGVSKTNFEGDFHGIVQPSFTHSPLAGGVTYYYVVTAQNTIGESDDSAEVSATVIPIPVPPDPPDGVAATPGIGQISLDWLPVADATTYNVYFSSSTGVSKSNFEGDFHGIVQPSFTHSPLAGGVTYYYVVTAQNTIGESDDSAEVSATVPVNSRLIGDFSGTGFGGDPVMVQFDPWSVLLISNFDGAGGGTYQEIATSDGPPFVSGSVTYNLDPDGSLTSTLSNGEVFNGILNADNNILAVADTDPSLDDFIEMDVLIKNSTDLTNAILDGDYIGVRISGFGSTALFSTTFDGNGNGAFEYLASSDQQQLSGEFTYSVDPNGDATISGLVAAASAGIVSGDGTVISMVDTDSSDDDEISMAVLIKTGTGLSNATLNGDYVGVSYGYSVGDGTFEETTVTSIRDVDGAGNMVFEILYNSEGNVGTINATYAVLDNGRISINLPIDEIYEGIVYADGEIFSFVNTDLNDFFIEIGIAIRKTQ